MRNIRLLAPSAGSASCRPFEPQRDSLAATLEGFAPLFAHRHLIRDVRSGCDIIAHPAFVGAPQHTDNAGKLTGFVETLPSCCRKGPGPERARVRVFFDSEYAAEVYLGSSNHVVFLCDWQLRVNDFLFFRLNTRLPHSVSCVQPWRECRQ